jgi:tetratricopeptide (TPR) repeat protein
MKGTKDMNMDFEAAMQYINLENYDKAAESLKKAIDKEMADDNESRATEYRCVLGELLANLDRREEARDEFAQALDYCNFSGELHDQKAIATAFIDAIDAGRELPNFSKPAAPQTAAPKRNPSVPLVPKPVQDKAFIAKKTSKRK